MIDQKDRKILNCLIDDARQSYREVAKKTGLSIVTVMKRVRALQKDGIIKQFTAMVDYEKLGFDLHAVIELEANKGMIPDLERFIAAQPNISRMFMVTGHVDAIAFGHFRNRRELERFIMTANQHPSVTNTVTRVVLSLTKDIRVKV